MISRRRWVLRTVVIVAGLLAQFTRFHHPQWCCVPYGPCRCGRY